MAHIVSAIILLCLVSVGFGQLEYNYVTTDNGADRGSWGPVERCPNGYVIKGVSIKNEEYQGEGDDTAVNGVRFHCFDKDDLNEVTVQSSVSDWGTWGAVVKCESGHVASYQLKVEPDQGDGDDTTVNNIRIQCSIGEQLEQVGSPWGSYGSWSKPCNFGGCGITTLVEPYQEEGDDTGLNDLRMYCCDE